MGSDAGRKKGINMAKRTHITQANSTAPYTDWDYDTLNALQDEVRKHVWYEMQRYQAEIQAQLYVAKNIDLGPIKKCQSRIMSRLLSYQHMTTIINKVVPAFRE